MIIILNGKIIKYVLLVAFIYYVLTLIPYIFDKVSAFFGTLF